MRRFEMMCAEALIDGTVTILGEGVNETITFGRNANHTLGTGDISAVWDGAGDPIEDINTMLDLIRDNAGLEGGMLICGREAANAFKANTAVRAALDTRRIDQGALAPRRLPNGVGFLGTIEGVEVWSYTAKYLHPTTGVETPYMPSKKVLLVAEGAERVFHFGAIQDLASLVAVPMFTDSYVTNEPSRRFVRLQSAPLPVPYQIDGTVVATVLA